ncbi:PaaI family thioesterase [Solicola gregarius]|uniref:PaaI family thioesterase n=1 Tax=Solicola gregarius TaxID=2908642 RepID=A0AA46TMQ0_9ACTN|nr:PaaI family thioesterase [Solicola gregarius]UYM07223.1 PaaI family thioesterase [Solicola gregarius]
MLDPQLLDKGLSKVLGLEYERVDRDGVVISWTVGEEHLQPWGIVHGGVYCSVNETAASIAAQNWFGDRGMVVGVNNTTDFLRQAKAGARLTATASPIHRGRSQQLWLIETHDAEGRMVARGQVRLANLPSRDAVAGD